MKRIILAIMVLAFAIPSEAQILKKLKDKVNKTIDKATGAETSSAESENSSSSSSADNGPDKERWCDTIAVEGVGDGVAYSLVYTSPGKMSIVYNESALGIGKGKKGYRLILSERVDGKSQFVIVEDGKVIDRDTRVKNEYVGGGVSDQFSVASGNGAARDEEMKKYIVTDSTTHNIAKTESKTVTLQKVDDKQMDMAISMAKQTDEYKSMSAEEKKEFEETMKKAMAQNNSMAGQTMHIPGQQGGSYSTITGYRLVVKGKTLAKFMSPPVVEVSDDGTKVFAVGIDDDANPVMIVNGKKTMLDKNQYTGLSGSIVRSSDLKKFVYIEQKKMSEDEMDKFYASNGAAKIMYNVVKPDGSSILIADHTSSGKFLLTNSGDVINVNGQTAEIFANGKRAGKFKVREGYSFNEDALLVGPDLERLAYYDGVEGSINYLDGTVHKLGIVYPTAITENGKNYITWFRKCGNKIYLAKYAY